MSNTAIDVNFPTYIMENLYYLCPQLGGHVPI